MLGAVEAAIAMEALMRTNPRFALKGDVSPPEVRTDPLEALLPAGNPRYLQGLWSVRDLERIGVSDRVLVLGVALSAIDAVLALDTQGHRGTVRVVSPRALLLTAGRIEPHAAARVAALRLAGRLEVCAGSVRGAEAYGDTFVVDVLPRGRALHVSERYDWILNCTAVGELTDSASRAAR
jgi:uncharacterized NAD(P)/FAD-binding protein YdhS